MGLHTKLRRLSPHKARRRRLPFPAAPHLRAAQLDAPALFESVEAFPRDRWNALETFRPHILVGSTADLEDIAEWVRRNAADLSSVDHAVFALTARGGQPLTDVPRVVFWQAFGVPVYELFLGAGGVLLAAECEAHEGWHAEHNVRFFAGANGELMYQVRGAQPSRTGLRGSLENQPCLCGKSGDRVLDLEPLIFTAPLRLAATA